MDTKDYYKILEIEQDATERQIKEAYRRKAFEFHPDRNQDNPEAASMMKSVNEAYAVLSNPGKRQQYDTLRSTYGDEAHRHFRSSYSEQDIFSNTDIQQIFEEMARAFGLRGFDDIFKDLQAGGAQSFQFRSGGGRYAQGFVFTGGGRARARPQARSRLNGFMGKLAGKMMQKLTGLTLPRQGEDWRETIILDPDFASRGGPYAFYHHRKEKKLVVQIPAGVKNGQKIRLTGMGQEGEAGGANGDLYLQIKLKQSIGSRIKALFGT